MKCECGKEIGIEDAIPKSVLRKWLHEICANAVDMELRLKAISLLAEIEQYKGANAAKGEKPLGVEVVQHSQVRGKPKDNRL